MATVWAPYIGTNLGRWADRAYVTGWSHTIHFSSLSNLSSNMSRRGGLRQATLSTRSSRMAMRNASENVAWIGKVSRLGILAHGTPGTVHLDRVLSVDSAPTFRADLRRLCDFLTPQAQVIFYSCRTGCGINGTEFLNTISRFLPGRTVIGFTPYAGAVLYDHNGLFSAYDHPPGLVNAAPNLDMQFTINGSPVELNPYCTYAKWSRNGNIVRAPSEGRDAQRHCANPNCGGHGNSSDNCPRWY